MNSPAVATAAIPDAGDDLGPMLGGLASYLCFLRFSAKELEEQDLEAFLASSDSETGDEGGAEETAGNRSLCMRQKSQAQRKWAKITEENLASFRQELLGVSLHLPPPALQSPPACCFALKRADGGIWPQRDESWCLCFLQDLAVSSGPSGDEGELGDTRNRDSHTKGE